MTITAKKSAARKATAARALTANQELALMDIAPRAYSEATSRAHLIAAIKTAGGTNPDKARLASLKREAVIGRITARLPVSAFPKSAKETADKMEHARALVCDYVSPDVKDLPKGKAGRRTDVQHKAIRACDEWWSKLLAEVGFGKAKTQAQADKQKKQRAATNTGANANPVRGADKTDDKTPAATTPTQEAMKTPKSKMSPVDACAHVERLASELLAFANKYAAALPGDYGAAIQTFKTSINTAHNSRLEREAAAASK